MAFGLKSTNKSKFSPLRVQIMSYTLFPTSKFKYLYYILAKSSNTKFKISIKFIKQRFIKVIDMKNIE